MKRRVAVAIACLLLVSAGAGIGDGASIQADTPVTMQLATADSVAPGNATTATAIIDTTVPVYGVEFAVEASPSLVTVESISQDQFLSQNGSSIVIVNRVNNSTGVYGETRIRTETGVTGNGAIATITLDVPTDVATDTIRLSFTSMSVVDPDAQVINSTVANGTINVERETATTPTPTATPTPTPTDSADTAPAEDNTATTTPTPTSTPSLDAEELFNETATPTQTATSSWQQTVDQRVLTALNQSDTVPVLVQVDSTASLDATAASLTAAGLANVSVNSDVGVVRGTTDAAAIQSVAQVDGVTRIRYATTRGETATQSQMATTTATSQSATASSEPAQSPDSNTSSTSPTSSSGPGFGPISVVLSLILVTLWRLR